MNMKWATVSPYKTPELMSTNYVSPSGVNSFTFVHSYSNFIESAIFIGIP